jgi:hypothetical protein
MVSFVVSCATLTNDDLTYLIQDLPRHDSFDYVNAETLPEDYFARAQDALSDPYVYIVLSDTRSPASKFISMFTHKQYNHASIAFDRNLTTMVSYNGGPDAAPGMNRENMWDLLSKKNAVVSVYRLPATAAAKQVMIDDIQKINTEGSSYNMLGLVFGYSARPNIMFCSQFVYTLLRDAGLNYFEKESAKTKPTDFIELDADHALTFMYHLS